MDEAPPCPSCSLLCCCTACLAARQALAQAPERPLVLNTDGAPPHSRDDGSGFEDRIVTELFRAWARRALVRLPPSAPGQRQPGR
jgi:hypothetical protein